MLFRSILTTAEKKGILKPNHKSLAAEQMMQLNKIGAILGNMKSVHAMTDVTGFGLLGHLTEMSEGSGVSGKVFLNKVPLITSDLNFYINQKCIPGGTTRNWESYGNKIGFDNHINVDYAKAILSDPQTSGGLLIAVDANEADIVKSLLLENGLYAEPIGQIIKQESILISICD